MRLSLVIDGNAAGAKQALDETSHALGRVQASSKTSAGALTEHSRGVDVARGSARGLSFEAKNLSYQLVDVAQGALSGQSAFMIMAQQGGQLAQVVGTSKGGLGGLMKELGGAIVGVLTPMRVLGAAALATGVAGYGLYSYWKSVGLQLDDTARSAGTTMRTMRELQTIAAGKGIDRNQFLPDMEKFAAQVYLARNGMGGLADVLRANGVQGARDFEDAFSKAANVIARARGDLELQKSLLSQMGLPATADYARFMEQGADSIRKARQEVVSFGGAVEDEMIKKARALGETWDLAWANMANRAQGVVVSVKASLNDLIKTQGWELLKKIATMTPTAVVGAATGTASGVRSASPNTRVSEAFAALPKVTVQESKPTDPEKDKADIARKIQALSLLGQTTTALEARQMVELQVQQAAAGGVYIDDERVKVLKRLAEEQALGITQIRAGIDAYRLEGETIGMTVGQSTAYLAAQNAILDAKRRGAALTADQVAWIEREAAAMGTVAQRTDDLKWRYDAAKGAFTTFRQEIAQGTGVWDALSKTAISALDKIGAKLGDLAFDQAWQAVFGSSGVAGGASSGGGIFASIGKLFGFAQGGYTGDVGRQAIAGVVHGKEFVINAQATARHRPLLEALNANRLPGYERGGYVGPPPSDAVTFATTTSKAPVTVTNTFSIDARGAQKGAGQEIAQALGEFAKSSAFERRVWGVVREGRARLWD
jgi:hypothetical protein